MSKIEERDIVEYETLSKKAANGPWEVHRFDKSDGFINYQVQQGVEPGDVISNVFDGDVKSARSTANFIASSRTMGPALCVALRAKCAEVVKIEAKLDVTHEQIVEVRGVCKARPDEITALAVRRALAERDATIERLRKAIDEAFAHRREGQVKQAFETLTGAVESDDGEGGGE
jgi:hypothetical protein